MKTKKKALYRIFFLLAMTLAFTSCEYVGLGVEFGNGQTITGNGPITCAAESGRTNGMTITIPIITKNCVSIRTIRARTTFTSKTGTGIGKSRA